jgi:hypothetical protein
MERRHPGLSKAIANSNLEAARVCLDRHHTPPVDFQISNPHGNTVASVEWTQTDDKARSAWANDIDATEQGSYTCVLAAIELLEGMVAVRRAETCTGADYYIAPLGETPEDLENCYRLEVSGTDKGDEASVETRLRNKIEQIRKGANNLPGIAGVVGFNARMISLSRLETT